MNASSPAPVTPPARVRLGSVPISPVTFGQTVELITGWAGREPFRLIVTPNVDHIVILERDAEFRAAYESAALSLIDGTPVRWAVRWLGLPAGAGMRWEKVSGSDLLPALCARGAAAGWRVFFIGGRTPAELEHCLELLRVRYPGLTAGGYCPPFGFEHDEAANQALLEALGEYRPDVIFAGVGSPKSEVWLARHAEVLGRGVGLSCGAGLRMLVGLDKRAPRWMQRAGLEWLWRLAQDPVRLWRRYLVRDAQFVPLVLKWKRMARRMGEANGNRRP